MAWYDYIPSVYALNKGNELLGKATDESASQKNQRTQLERQGKLAGRFATVGEQGYRAMGQEAEATRNYLRDLAMGKNSVTAEQLRQGLQQNQAAQMSMAAGAAPQNATMAARTAANNAARLGYGMAGQQAVAGLQERNDAQRALAQMILEQRGQDMQVALGSRQNAISGYGGYKPEGSWWEKNGGLIQAGATAAAMSDERLKTDVRNGDDDARAVLRGLAAKSFKYKDEKYGKGKQLGIMAQDLERSGMKHAVIDTPAGKAVDGAKAATTGLALMAALNRRVEKLEKGKR